MKVLFFGNDALAVRILRWLRSQDADICGLVLNPSDRRRSGDDLISASGLDHSRIFDGAQLQSPDTLARLRDLAPDIGVSVLFSAILRPEVFALPHRGIVNAHASYLPFNRGAYPNVWSIVERTPAGVSLHLIDDGIDTGPLLAQAEVAVEAIDTGETLYRKLEEASFGLFTRTWPGIADGTVALTPQPGGGSTHRTSDVGAIDKIDLDATYSARELIDVIRARTFPPHSGAYFVDKGRKVYMRLELEYEGEDGA